MAMNHVADLSPPKKEGLSGVHEDFDIGMLCRDIGRWDADKDLDFDPMRPVWNMKCTWRARHCELSMRSLLSQSERLLATHQCKMVSYLFSEEKSPTMT